MGCGDAGSCLFDYFVLFGFIGWSMFRIETVVDIWCDVCVCVCGVTEGMVVHKRDPTGVAESRREWFSMRISLLFVVLWIEYA